MKDWQVNAVDGIDVTYTWGPWEIHAAWPERNRRGEITTLIRVRHLETDPARQVMSSSRVDLHSWSKKSQIGVAMRRIDKTDKDGKIDQFVHEACENLLEWFQVSGHSVDPMPKQLDGARYLMWPIWPATEGTLVNAASNSFKSWLAVAIAVACSLGVEILKGNTRPTEPIKILYIDWEGHQDTFGERLYAVLQGAGLPLEPCVAYRRLTTSFADAAVGIAEEVKRRGIGGVIIDSLSAAVGGSLNDDDVAREFWNAVALLDVPVLVLAHKSREAIAKGRKAVFGSAMHENRPRFIWDAVRPDMEGPGVLWEVYNDNNMGMLGHKLAWDVQVDTEGEFEERRLVSATFTATNPNDVSMKAVDGDTLTDEIYLALRADGPLMHRELASAMGANEGSVKTALYRNKALFQKRDDARWELTTNGK